jgi:hypothetical protein
MTSECIDYVDEMRSMGLDPHGNYRCPNCGSAAAVSADFKPIHFTGRLARLSEGYCTINCAKAALIGLQTLNAMSGGKLAASLA